MCPRLCGHDPTKFLMSTLYYHIIVKYFHIDDEMQFLNYTYHKTSWHLPIKKPPAKQKYTYMWTIEEMKNLKQIMINEWINAWKRLSLCTFCDIVLLPSDLKLISFLSYKCDFLVHHTTVIVNSVVPLKWIYMYIQWILCLTLKVSPYFFKKYLIIKYIF